MIDIDISTEEKRDELYKLFDSFSKKGDIYNYFGIRDSIKNIKYINYIAHEIGFDFASYKLKKDKYCLQCGKKLTGSQKKFCSSSCSATYNNLKRGSMKQETKQKINASLKKSHPEPSSKNVRVKEKKFCEICGRELNNSNKTCSKECLDKLISRYNEKKLNDSYEYYLSHEDEFCRPNYIPKKFRNKFIEEQGGVCAICGMTPIWNGKDLVFIIDHIDGDASNNRRDNLRCICSNCDSQLDTYKSKNKNSKRTNYWKEKLLRESKNK